MAEYDLSRLSTAIQYLRRMGDGKNPVTNRPVQDENVLDNPNVIRCLFFIREVLEDVARNHGTVGSRRKVSRLQAADSFPYEVLGSFQYREDLPISYFLRQVMELLPEGHSVRIQATAITDWLRSNGYLEKKMVPEVGKETSCPTAKGRELGIHSEIAGLPPNQYLRLTYNQNAQEFLVSNFSRILHESAEEAQERRAARNQSQQQSPMPQSDNSIPDIPPF